MAPLLKDSDKAVVSSGAAGLEHRPKLRGERSSVAESEEMASERRASLVTRLIATGLGAKSHAGHSDGIVRPVFPTENTTGGSPESPVVPL